jgi:hypothetical protein
MNTTTDERRYGVITTKFHELGEVALYVLSINDQVWAQVEWSPSRQTWCVMDGSGRCLAHCDAIHGSDIDAQTAITLAKRMIVAGSMPTPEEAREALNERLAADEQHNSEQTRDLHAHEYGLGEPWELLEDRHEMVPIGKKPND